MIEDIDIAEKIDDNEIIWRYMDFASFYTLLQSGGLFFRRLDKYTDEYEGSLPDEIKEYLFNSWSGFFGPSQTNENISKFCGNLKQLNTGTLSSSWVANPKEIYAMWKIYLRGSQEGISLRTTVGKLKEALSLNPSENFTFAKVSYEVLSWMDTDYKSLAAYKSKPYSYESELRVLVYNQFEMDTVPLEIFPKIPLYEHGKSFTIDINKLVESIYISPFTGEWFYDVVKSVILTFMPSFDTSKIITSRIKDK